MVNTKHATDENEHGQGDAVFYPVVLFINEITFSDSRRAHDPRVNSLGILGDI